ncbi:DUF2188 domain-containing protein [Fluoribacter dumoffii]|uniref:DUF2188 domain-containing protein n=1 Tax=Fluoribacter dumoffii TaxID=463 RepID=A0A377GDN2_9GAMM|nr:DUF2188 domain-containing protein [Fluoribacter dumoffii]KTC91217.1 hypothetical protein Ldum_2285 [Fluoribacter dumoffii NY 23]MCW8387615.1 DUF2188 domain-containing protein [Fluoribacter dumoffii]MCW8416840.1 DUF2188 domain-containing protein [Fluoribacter dumoffii]MCW8455320.1 DUF2188 domain-containing protein [Fluoribacter dumoffii]MCW8460602.1 DUF2188 domain-containing protein [Fluoribacter dumoffii]
MNKEHHVVHNVQGGWDIEQTHNSSILHFKSKKEAVDKARELSKKEHTELVIHDKYGRIETKDSHGHDPRNIRG